MFDSFLQKGWVLADARQHPLGRLQHRPLGPYKLIILIGGKNRFGATRFQIFLQNNSGHISQQPVTVGLYSQGRYPSYNWIEVSLVSGEVSFSDDDNTGADLYGDGLAQQLLDYMAELVPPGGHLMVEYESPEHRDTASGLILGIPPAATPLGHMLWRAGCGASFRDWYFAEGGLEGPRKLQAFKALSEKNAVNRDRKNVDELKEFCKKPSSACSALEKEARKRARNIIEHIDACAPESEKTD